MAGDDDQLVVETAVAEPEECSRWVVSCLLVCLGVVLVFVAVCLPCNDDDKPPCLGPIFFILGLLCFAFPMAFVLEHFDGGDPHGGMSVDWLLNL
jgi:hypothetical protein